jgi:hypothetical protein
MPTPTLPIQTSTSVEDAPAEQETEPDIQPQPTPLPIASPPTPTPGPTATFTPTPLPGSALQAGQPARVTAPAGLNYRDAPSTNATLVGQFGTGQRVTVLEGPVDSDNFRWWKIDDGQGNAGWAAEGDGDTVWISPQLGEPQAANRPPRVGDRVVVTMAAGGQLTVRRLPSTDGAIITRVDPGQEYTVLAGPQSAGGYTWYEIRSDDGSLQGWAADGDGAERWLSPLE